jgi:hypothetical protein
MDYGTILVKLSVSYFLIDVILIIFFKNVRQNLKTKSIILDEIRDKPIKTLDEQKAFLDAKFGQIMPIRFSWNTVVNIIKNVIIFAIMYFCINYIFNKFNIIIPLGIAILIIIIMPIIFTLIFRLFGIKKNNMLLDVLR